MPRPSSAASRAGAQGQGFQPTAAVRPAPVSDRNPRWSGPSQRAVLVLDAKDLAADVADSAMALRTVARQLSDEAWARSLRVPGLAPFPAAQLLARRLVEVELHHCDLAAGYGPADWPDSFASAQLAEPMATQRQDRVSRPQELLDSVPPLRPARVPPRPRNVGPLTS